MFQPASPDHDPTIAPTMASEMSDKDSKPAAVNGEGEVSDSVGSDASRPSSAVSDSRSRAAATKRWLRKRWLRMLAVSVVLGGALWSEARSEWSAFLNERLPSPAQVALWVDNVLEGRTKPLENRFRIVSCWLQYDRTGEYTRSVEEAFKGVEGFQVVRSARVVAASGGGSGWIPAMQERARRVLEDWNADLAIVGLVKQSGTALNLWIVPRSGKGTLGLWDHSYQLLGSELGSDFHERFRAELVSAAFVAVHRFAGTEARGQALEKGLRDLVEKLTALLDKYEAIQLDERQAHLRLALGHTLMALGRLDPGGGSLEEAVDVYRATLEGIDRQAAPLDWAGTQNDLGLALQELGSRDVGTERLAEAVDAHRAALEESDRESMPLDWVMKQNSLGIALMRLAARDSGTEYQAEALLAFRAARESFTQDPAPHGWAMTQNNLGNTLLELGRHDAGTELLEEALKAIRAALEGFDRESAPLDWAAAQGSLGNVLTRLGERDTGTDLLEQAVDAYSAALEEYPRERMPLEWAGTQHNLSHALTALGERDTGTERLDEAVVALRAALEERTRERVPLDWALTQNSLGNALLELGEHDTGTERVEEAVAVFRAALEELTRERVPLSWAMTQNNLGTALLQLGEGDTGTEYLEEAVAAHRAALEEFTHQTAPLDWAMTQIYFGKALLELGKRDTGTEHLEEAERAFNAALTIEEQPEVAIFALLLLHSVTGELDERMSEE